MFKTGELECIEDYAHKENSTYRRVFGGGTGTCRGASLAMQCHVYVQQAIMENTTYNNC